jgi:hypothetical protein
VIGGLAIIWGVLRLLGIAPRLTVNLSGRTRLNPVVEGVLGLVIGVVLVVVGLLQ